MRFIFTLFISCFFMPRAGSQTCVTLPNTPDLYLENKVKKELLWVEDKSTGKKYLLTATFFDSAGHCYKTISRDQSGYSNRYRINVWKEGKLVRWSAFGQIGPDSSEVITSEDYSYYSPTGQLLRTEHVSNVNGNYRKTVQVRDTITNIMNNKTYVLDKNNDTIEKSFTVDNGKTGNYYYLVKKNGAWTEKQKRSWRKNDKGETVMAEWQQDGRVVSRSYYHHVYSGTRLTEKLEFDMDSVLIRKSVFNHDETIHYTYKDGKLADTYYEYQEVSDPIDPDPVPIDPRPPFPDPPKEKKQPAPKPKKIKHKPYVKEYWNDPVKKDRLIMTESFDETGLIQERNVIWDNKVYTWVYERF